MIVNTRRLFVRLLRILRVDVVCDVGSMNGADALRFRAAVPSATIYAFEAHPENHQLMRNDPELQRKGIAALPLAVTDYDGEADFFVTTPGYSSGDAWRGMSSLHRRFARPHMLTVTRVRATRLDTFLADKVPPDAHLALWIDVEGKAYEVIDGAASMMHKVRLLHVEVETTRCIGDDQKCYPQVKAMLCSAGFSELATDGPADRIQFNAVFVRSDLTTATRRKIAIWLAVARLRHFLVCVAQAICPICVRWYGSARTRAVKR